MHQWPNSISSGNVKYSRKKKSNFPFFTWDLPIKKFPKILILYETLTFNAQRHLKKNHLQDWLPLKTAWLFTKDSFPKLRYIKIHGIMSELQRTPLRTFLFLVLILPIPWKCKPTFMSVIRRLLKFRIWTFSSKEPCDAGNFSYHLLQSVAEASARPSGSKPLTILTQFRCLNTVMVQFHESI